MKRVRAFPLDYLTTLLLFLLMPFLFGMRKIPLNYEWTGFFIPYWISVSIYSVFAAALLYLTQSGVRSTANYPTDYREEANDASSPFLSNRIALVTWLLEDTRDICRPVGRDFIHYSSQEQT